MILIPIFLGTLLFLVLLALLTAYICFRRIFYSPDRDPHAPDTIPEGKIYEERREQLETWMQMAHSLPHKSVSIRSFDGLLLRARYYEHHKGAPIEILLHGYRGNAIRDLSGGIQRCFRLEHNVLIVEHRASGQSEGNVITFGVNESRDCEAWVNFVLREIDPEAKIILAGVSMGAATAMICASRPLPKNLVGVLADCGYTSARAIISKVMRDMHLPPKLLYPFVRLGARLFGHFDPDSASPIESLANSRLPVLLLHGDTDDFVPYRMSEENYEACITEKRLVCIHGAGHGVAFPVDPEAYLAEAKQFFSPYLS